MTATRSIILQHIREIADKAGNPIVPLTDHVPLLDSGLDSLGLAILVARLEEAFGFDPFSESTDISYPVTLGDFITLYERVAEANGLDLGKAG
jgi:acyl carrier protein